MKLSHLFVFVLLFSFTVSAQGRKPAVEDFVGVETEGYKKTPKGTEVLFDFGNQVDKSINKSNHKSSKVDIDIFSSFILIAFSTLPFLMWFGINQSIKEQKKVNSTQTPPQTATSSNVQNLDEYRQNSEQDEDKMAS